MASGSQLQGRSPGGPLAHTLQREEAEAASSSAHGTALDPHPRLPPGAVRRDAGSADAPVPSAGAVSNSLWPSDPRLGPLPSAPTHGHRQPDAPLGLC